MTIRIRLQKHGRAWEEQRERKTRVRSVHETMVAMNNKRRIGNAAGKTKRTNGKLQLKRFCLMRFNHLSFHRIIRQTTATQFNLLFFSSSAMNFGDLLSCVLRKSLNHRSDITRAVRNCVCETFLVIRLVLRR